MKKQNKRKACTCKEWIKLVPQIDSVFTMAWTHGYMYTGTPWRVCPWCGEKLK